MPIFKNFIKQALYKEDFKEFSIPENIYFAPINYNTGERTNFDDPKAIIEAFKSQDMKKLKNDNFDIQTNYDRMIKFRQFY